MACYKKPFYVQITVFCTVFCLNYCFTLTPRPACSASITGSSTGTLLRVFGIRVSGLGFGVRVSNFGYRIRVSGFRFRVSGLGFGFRVSDFGQSSPGPALEPCSVVWVWDFGGWVCGFGFWGFEIVFFGVVFGFWCVVLGSGFRVPGSADPLGEVFPEQHSGHLTHKSTTPHEKQTSQTQDGHGFRVLRGLTQKSLPCSAGPARLSP